MTPVHSSQLQFSRDGRTLTVAERDAVSVVDLHGDGRRRIAISGVQAVAAFVDQIWIATRAGVLHRFGSDGRALDVYPIPVDPDATLCPTTIGPASALWTGCEPMILVEDLGRFTSVPTRVATAIPVVGRRLAHYAGPRLTLPAGTAVTLANGAHITGGCVVLDGTSLALVAEHPHGRSLVVVALASGRLLQTVAAPQGTIRIAARRGLAVVQEAARRLVVMDLKFGHPLGMVVTDDDVTDVAIDPNGQVLALRLACGELELAPVSERRGSVTRMRLSTPQGVKAVEVAPERRKSSEEAMADAAGAPPNASEPPPAPLAADSSVSAQRPVETLTAMLVDALEPRAPRARLPRTEALVELNRELRSVSLWAVRAIASAWDTRQLGYGNEGPHPHEHEVAAIDGRNAGFAADQLARANRALAEHDRALAADPAFRGPSTPIADLAEEFGLSAVAIDVLLAVAAPLLDGDIARLYGIAKNDPGRVMVDEQLLRYVLDERVSRYDLATELQPHAPLVRFGLIHVDPSQARPFAALEVDEVVLSRLRGEPLQLGMMPVVRAAGRELAELALAPGVLMSTAAALARAGRPARIAVRGRAGTGRRSLLAALAHRAGRALGVIDASQLPRDAERLVGTLKAALQCAQLAGLFPVVHGLEAVVLGERTGSELAREALAVHPGPLAVITPPDASPPLPIGHVVIDLPALSETERLAVWESALVGSGHWLRDAAGLAARYRVGAGVIHRAIAATTGMGADPMTPCDDQISAFLRQSRDVRLADHARRVEHLARWADLVLPSDIMDSLRELVGRVGHRRTVFEDWGATRAMATSRGLTALFQGQPGTGKTLVAGVIARELGLDLYQVDLSKVMSKWLGETERNLATLFDAAEDGQVILLFDEADSLFAKRTEIRSSNDRYANLEVNYLLQRLDAFEGIAILTTNSGGSIDPAFKRRLSFQLSFPFPDEETRAALWRTHLPPSVPRGEELVFDELAHKYQLSGGYIRNACLRAMFLAAQEETTLHQHHLERAVAREFAEMGKLSTTGTIA